MKKFLKNKGLGRKEKNCEKQSNDKNLAGCYKCDKIDHMIRDLVEKGKIWKGTKGEGKEKGKKDMSWWLHEL